YVQMQLEALKQVILWTPQAVQDYCKDISAKGVAELRTLGCYIEDDTFRSHHLFGLTLPDTVDVRRFKEALLERHIFVSFRGAYVRLSCHFFNTESDFDKFVNCLKSVMI
ncbi:MAG: aminotransferase, partial [Gelidibacter sp.]